MKRLDARLSSTIALLSTICVVSWASSASAQPATPSDGIDLPDASVATQADATALEVNPAGLGFMDTVEIGYGFNLNTEDLEGVSDEGHAMFLAGGNQVLGGGFGVQWLERPDLGGELDDFRKYTLAGSLALPRKTSIGVGFNWFGSDRSERLDELSSVDLGIQWRPLAVLGVGVSFRDLNGPFLRPDEALPTRVTAGTALRLWDGRLVLDNEFGFIGGFDRLLLRPRLNIEPFSGLRLFGRTTFDMQRQSDDVDFDWNELIFGMELSFGSLGVQYGPMFERFGTADQPQISGVSAYHWISPNKQRSLIDPGRRWIYIDLNVPVSEGEPLGLFAPKTRTFLSLIEDLDRIAHDETVEGVVFTVGDSDIGYGQAWEVRAALARLRDAGKQTVSVLTDSDLKQYYVSTAADEIWFLPSSTFFPGGLKSRMLFLPNLLESIGVEAQFVRIGAYKSAPEMFVYDDSTDENREQRTEYLDTLYDAIVDGVADRREKKADDVEAMLESSPLLPDEALDQNYVDHAMYLDEIEENLRRRFGSYIALEKEYFDQPTREERWGIRPEIAVVAIEGTIVRGTSGSPIFGGSLAGSETLTEVFEALRLDPNVRAVVVRVNSPGGSAVASDLIYRQIRRLSQAKPVVASMGNVAASGGYYVAAGADEIFATPTTATGSIGIFAGRFNVADLAKMIGIHSEVMERGNPISYGDIWEPWTDEEFEDVGRSMNYMYRLFLEQAARTRPLTAEELDKVARGRVWTGSAAVEAKLVDESGGLFEALTRAQELAGIDPGEARFEVYPEAGFTFGLSGGTVRDAARWIGLSNDRPAIEPKSVLGRFLGRLERAVLLPLLFAPGEALMLPMTHIELE